MNSFLKMFTVNTDYESNKDAFRLEKWGVPAEVMRAVWA